MREDLQRQFSSDADNNPLAVFQRMAVGAMREGAQRQAEQLRAMDDKLGAMREELVRLQSERAKLAELEAERERGTAKGRTFEELVADAIDAIALVQGDACDAVGDVKGAWGRTGDVVVDIDACSGPARGRIVFEAKTAKLSRPKALEELDEALQQRDANFAVLVVPNDEKVPAKMRQLREYNGDKLIVTFDPETDGQVGLELAYSLARARVLMSKSESDGIDTSAVRHTVERALNAMEQVRRVKSQLTGAKTSIDNAHSILEEMAGHVREHLKEIDRLVADQRDEAEATQQTLV
jgi:hypothetical protein